MDAHQSTPEEKWLADQWVAQLGGVLTSMTGESPELAWTASPPPCPELADVEPEAVLWGQQFPIAEESALWIYAAAEAWKDLGSRTLRAAGIESDDPDDLRNTYLELIDQSLSGMAQSLGARLLQVVPSGDGTQHSTMPSGVAWLSVRIQFPKHEARELTLGLAPGLSRSLNKPVEAGTIAESREEPVPLPVGSPSEAKLSGGIISKTFDVLLDVALPVSVSFGRTQLPIKDVLKLTTGSIVELNRSVSEPVEVIVNNCIIARGEVVVVEGNYGVRIHQIVSRDERMRQTSDTLQNIRHSRNLASLAVPESVQ